MSKRGDVVKTTHEAIGIRSSDRENNGIKRVAAYCRVSTLLEEQELSYESQCAYYESLIGNTPNMELVGVYGDHGFSGLHAKNRPEFQRMVKDCLDGKIDLVMVKSISRFSRNTLECQHYVNLLKEHGVAIHFEREGINSVDPQCELILKLLSAAAQEESNSLSQAIQWAHLKNNECGNPTRVCPFLAMFVSNLTPITIIAAAGGLSQEEIAILLQNAMFIAGIATLIQLYPIWKIGSGLPIVMGVSFTFVTVLSTIAANYGYPTVMGAVLVGGIFEGTLGLLAKYWRKIISPIVAASVVTAIGFSLFTVGARSFGGGYHEDFGSAQNLILGTITLIVCLVWNCLATGYLLPPVGNFFASLPDSVLGGCTIMMFGTILTSGMQMVAKAGFSQRNILMNGVFTMPKEYQTKDIRQKKRIFI